MYFSFWLLSRSSLLGLQFVKVLIKLFVCSLDLCLHSFSRILLRSSLLSLFWILFQINCLSPLHLVVLVHFYLGPSSATYFFVTSFCWTYHVCVLLSTGYRVIVAFASGVCFPVVEAGPEACAVFPLLGGLACVVTTACLGCWVRHPFALWLSLPCQGLVCSLVVGIVAPELFLSYSSDLWCNVDRAEGFPVDRSHSVFLLWSRYLWTCSVVPLSLLCELTKRAVTGTALTVT